MSTHRNPLACPNALGRHAPNMLSLTVQYAIPACKSWQREKADFSAPRTLGLSHEGRRLTSMIPSSIPLAKHIRKRCERKYRRECYLSGATGET